MEVRALHKVPANQQCMRFAGSSRDSVQKPKSSEPEHRLEQRIAAIPVLHFRDDFYP